MRTPRMSISTAEQPNSYRLAAPYDAAKADYQRNTYAAVLKTVPGDSQRLRSDRRQFSPGFPTRQGGDQEAISLPSMKS
jgi:hypothetical protein